MMTIRGGPPLSNTRTSLPQIKSKFDLEPNPFEQSFKDNPSDSIQPTQPNTNSPSLDHLLNGPRHRRTRSSSPHRPNTDHQLNSPIIRHTPSGSLLKVSLPGINSITSPVILLNKGNGSNTPKSLSPPTSSSVSQPLQASLSVSMPSYGWSLGGLGDSLRAGPLSPALLNGPAPVRAAHPVPLSGLTPLIDLDNSNTNGAITPGTQALIALLSCNDQSNDIRTAAVDHGTLASSDIVPSSNSADSRSQNQDNCSMNLVNTSVEPKVRPNVSIHLSPISESLSTPGHKPSVPTFQPGSSHPLDPTSKSSSSSAFEDLNKSSTSTNHSSSSSPQTLHNSKTSKAPSRSRLAPVSMASVHDSTTSSPSPSTSSCKREPSLSSGVPLSSMSSSVGPSSVASLHSLSPLSISQSTLSSMNSFSGPSTTPRPFAPQTAASITLPGAPPIPSSSKITVPLSPTPSTRSLITPLTSNPSDRMDDHYNSNPLYLLTVAHEASSRLSQLPNLREPSHHHDVMDDATATAAAALTGLGSSGGSRYSSPGPTIKPGGVINAQHPLINNLHSSQSMILKHNGVLSSVTSPTLPSHRPNNSISDPSSIPTDISLRPETAISFVSGHQESSFPTEPRGQHLNTIVPRSSSSASGSGAQLAYQPGYSSHTISHISSLNMPDGSGSQSFPSIAPSTSKKKGKKRKEGGNIEPSNYQQHLANHQEGVKAQRLKTDAQTSSSLSGLLFSQGTDKGLRSAAPINKAKKSKKAREIDDLSGDDSDSRDGYWGTEDDAAFMKQQAADDGDMGGYSSQSHINANFEPDPSSVATNQASGGKPETEEEKRKNFLERNRQAALKCRQRKKAWLAGLQNKVEYLSTENESLQMTINQLREEIDSFKSILISHKDCPITVGGGRGASTTIGELIGRETGLVAASAAAILAQQHHNNSTRVGLPHPQPPNLLRGQAPVAGTLSSSANGPIGQSHPHSHGAVASSFGY